MTGLDALLAGNRTPDLYRWSAPIGVDVAQVVTNEGWEFVLVDTTRVSDRLGAVRVIETSLGIEPRTVHDFEDLASALRRVHSAMGIVLLWQCWADLAANDPDCFSAILAVLDERASDVEYGRFAVLLQEEPGRYIDLPEL